MPASARPSAVLAPDPVDEGARGRRAGDPGDRPATADPERLPDSQGNPALDPAAGGPWGGRLVDDRRVGQTHLVVGRRRACPWPLSWLPALP
jgi:hypothetical protein